ncbi:hypothetical protein [Brenneria izbisi]|uniref:Uncharacterized protein n=1 Tax=Brenneria izbisi TaxID=2939450 RepID=A0AA41Y3G3_9GAMM|nr:hypothetical protein [Brenneria izbisi]MCV9880002.1 hypothetical protein [Brenneria izbisi]MCV9883391.1 hypothetical protein [Brenneria izbisi]
MEISNSVQLETNLYNLKKQDEPRGLVYGTIPELTHDTDSVQISTEGRQLAASAVVEHTARYFFTPQINESLSRVLQNQSSEVQETVYGIIQSNFMTSGNSDEESAALRELGMTQAGYIAANYMQGAEAREFMDTIRRIVAIANTKTTDPETGQVSYATLPQRPVGAPEDYIKSTDLMRLYEPETLEALENALAENKDWANILTSFTLKAINHPTWVKDYRAAVAEQVEEMQESVGSSRFQSASTASLADFSAGIAQLIAGDAFTDTRFLTNNMAAFIRKLGAFA